MLVRELMSTPVLMATPALLITDALHLMHSRGIRRLPITEHGQLVGIVTERDVHEAMPKRPPLSPWTPKTCLTGARFTSTTHLTALCLRDIMRRQVLTTTPNTDTHCAAQTMLMHGIGALPVVNDSGEVIGIFTVTDVLRDYVHNFERSHTEVSSISTVPISPTSNPPYIKPDRE